MDKFERGQRVKMGIYDDASGFTNKEMKLYWETLSKDSVDTGINIFDDRFFGLGAMMELRWWYRISGYCMARYLNEDMIILLMN